MKKGDWKDLKKYQKATQKFFENWKADIIAQYPAPVPSQVSKALADIDAQLTAINACNPCIIENETAATEGEGSPVPRGGPNVEWQMNIMACEVNFQALDDAKAKAKVVEARLNYTQKKLVCACPDFMDDFFKGSDGSCTSIIRVLEEIKRGYALQQNISLQKPTPNPLRGQV
nr:hypothetical protein [Sediminibacterium sp.]